MDRKDKELKFIFVTGSLRDKHCGPYYSLHGLTHSLCNLGHNVKIIGTHGRGELEGADQDWQQIKVKTLHKIGPSSMHFAPGIEKEMRSERNNVDIVFFQGVWMYHCWIAAKVCREYKIPYVISARGNLNKAALNTSRWKKSLANVFWARTYIENAHCIHALNIQEAKFVTEETRIPIAIIPNGVNLPEMGTEKQSGSKRTLLYLGRLHPIKNVHGLLKAWSGIDLSLRRDWELVLAGDGTHEYKAHLKVIIRRHGMGDQIRWKGFVSGEKKVNLLRRADAFVLPSFSEGLPMAALEAMAYRLPAILSYECNLFTDSSCHGVILTKTDPNCLSESMSKLMRQKSDSLQEMGRACYDQVSKMYTWDSVGRMTVKLAKWIISGGSEPEFVMQKESVST